MCSIFATCSSFVSRARYCRESRPERLPRERDSVVSTKYSLNVSKRPSGNRTRKLSPSVHSSGSCTQPPNRSNGLAAGGVIAHAAPVANTIRTTAAKYWEIIAGDLTERCWTWGMVSLLDSEGRKLFNVDAHRDGGKRYVVSSDELLTAFLELQTQIRQQR